MEAQKPVIRSRLCDTVEDWSICATMASSFTVSGSLEVGMKGGPVRRGTRSINIRLAAGRTCAAEVASRFILEHDSCEPKLESAGPNLGVG